jgi:Skp family chaperone for outer membrane proteins
MNLQSLAIKILAALLLLFACLLGGYLYGHHEGAQAGAAALAQYKATQAQAITRASTAAQQAQAQADAAQLIQAQDAATAAQEAASQREALVQAQTKQVIALQQKLHAIPSSDTAAATWLGPLPTSIQQALNTGGAP